MSFDIQLPFDALCRKSAIALYQKNYKDAPLVGFVFMLYVNLCYSVFRDVIIYHESRIIEIALLVGILLLYGKVFHIQYTLIRYKKVNRFYEFIWKRKYHFKTFEQANEVVYHYDFGESEFVLFSTYSGKKRRRPYRKMRKLYLTEEYICEGKHLYIERASLPEADYLKLQQFLEGKVPKKYIYHALM